MSGEAASGSQVRWWVAGAFTPNPSGRRFRITPDTYAEELARAATGLRVSVADRLGAGETRTFELSFPKQRSFTVAEVVSAVPELRALRALMDGLDKLPADAAEKSLEAVVGAGRLSEAVGTLLREKQSPPAPKGSNGVAPQTPSAPKQPDLVDSIFAQAETARPTQAAKAGVDAFLKAVGPRSTSPANPASVTAPAKALVEEAVQATARDVLAHPLVARLESAWRGVKMLVDLCPTSSGMAVEVLDVEGPAGVEGVEQQLPIDRFERPDALFVLDAVDDVAVLRRLAELGERAQLPVVVDVPPSLFGVKSAAEVATRVEEEVSGLPEAWAALRAEESSRWLCAALHRVVVMVDGQGARRRACFTSASLGVASMLASSFRETGSFARILGGTGGVQAPSVWQLPPGRDGGTSVPTEAFFPMRTQSKLAELGVLGLGSGKNSDVLQLTAAPMVYGGEHKVPLPAQILTGRIVRFAQWVRDQLPPSAGDAEVSTLFTQAADIFLFGGATPAGRVRGEVVSTGEGTRGVQVTALVRPEYAGMPLELGFVLPMRG
ncbi:type VI secretion system contractile sheath large subunit [Archangium violaceum]|uniref:type VI secretion system contractile sheath domain-containing protein n=1 Tax=Archangium violaceum TaxID=83451 RepID=UPI00193B5CF4|nr:type VI secretion system contractile sheath large subunit [Archangium violaceum]QRK12226.1 type VI secretion system contractile sheath large subunit [Archangium violaceum]